LAAKIGLISGSAKQQSEHDLMPIRPKSARNGAKTPYRESLFHLELINSRRLCCQKMNRATMNNPVSDSRANLNLHTVPGHIHLARLGLLHLQPAWEC
jgi:hypothetical protein